ncbi:MAG: PepSY domain-containing protein [Phycisphaerales bacterium]|nr:PepSY domain-containing protein [Phycisphaerales bacterium]
MQIKTLLRTSVLLLATAAGTPALALAAGGDDFGVGIVLPAPASVISIATAEQTSLAAVPRATLLRIELELENGRWVYRGELAARLARTGARVDINATTGAVVRTRADKLGGSDQRHAVTIFNRASEIRFSFAQAADAALAVAPGLVTDVKLETEGRTIVYKVTTHTQTSRSETGVNATTGAVIRTSTIGTPSGGGDDNSGGSSGGGSGGGDDNSGGSSGGGSGGGDTIPSPTGQAAVLAASIDASLAASPQGALPIEVKPRRRNMVMFIEVLVGVPGRTSGLEFLVDPVSGRATRESTLLGEDGTVLTAFTRALGTQAAIGFGGAMQIAADASQSGVSRAELGVYRGQPIYEVKVLSGRREVSVKVNAVTGAIVP